VDEDAQGSLGHLYPSGPLGLSGEWQGHLASTYCGSSPGLCSDHCCEELGRDTYRGLVPQVPQAAGYSPKF
jgi:hypothetical protein